MNLQDTYRYNTQVPLSNQYLSKTTSPLANNTVVPTDLTNINISKAQHNNSLPSSLPLNANRPSIQRVIPAEGPINGGIEVTLLGFNFKPNLVVKFGENVALSLQHWNESTIVTYLPPAAQAGPVDVTIMDPNDPDHHLMEMMHPTNKVIFTYVDDTDRQLLELALKIVGMKMNGKLEEARNVAKRILGSDPTSPPSSSSSSNISPANVGSHQYNTCLLYTSQLGKFELIEHSLQEFMKLDASAIKALNLFPQGPVQPFGPTPTASFGTASGGKLSLIHI